MAEIRWTNTAREEYHAILKSTYEFSMDVAIDLDERIEALRIVCYFSKNRVLLTIKFRPCAAAS